jgi:hypothetical protein
VPPAVINAERWEWMKRYRVWEANRKIFLYPENWLEPEFRDDKSHLFAELEGVLLQGDVSDDLADDALFRYLSQLDALARLDIVALHLEDRPDPALNVLHVIGRTHSQPHEYFYRRYSRGLWTPWEPVTAEIEGDHLAPVIWRGRLYLFWVTFAEKPDPSTPPPTSTGETPLASLPLSDVMTDVKRAGQTKTLAVQLHWSEYHDGEWSTRQSGALIPVTTPVPGEEDAGLRDARELALPTSGAAADFPMGPVHPGFFTQVPVAVALDYDVRSILIHVAKELDEDGEEGGVFIHLGDPGTQISQSFYLAGRNSSPIREDYSAPPSMPYSAGDVQATRYGGSAGNLQVEFRQRITPAAGGQPADSVTMLNILQSVERHTLLPTNNAIELAGAPIDAAGAAAGEVAEAVASVLPTLAALVKPFFYHDEAHTFFVEPQVAEWTIEEWEDWLTPTPRPDPDWDLPDWWEDLVVIPAVPDRVLARPPGGGDPRRALPLSPDALIGLRPAQDWLVNPATGLLFDGELIAPGGRVGLALLSSAAAAGVLAGGGQLVHVHSGSGLAPGSAVVAAAGQALEQAGLSQAAGGLNVVGGSGHNSSLALNLIRLQRGFGGGRAAARNGRNER